ncbi:MAG: SulP family inorganic anion transporter [Thermodesulfobacteriota bacterium]
MTLTMTSLFPFLTWFRDYDRALLRADLMAGLTVALVLIPQSMAYAQLAGLPSHYGLYAAFLPPMVAALFGSSRLLATGPVAVVSLMTAASLEPLATTGSTAYIGYAVTLALLVGLFQFLLGVLRLGLVVNFLSHPVVNGFTNAAAIIIATSQLAKMFGIEVEKAAHHHETVLRVLREIPHASHWPTFGMALLAIAIMLGTKRYLPKIPGILPAVAITTSISWATGFENNRVISLDQVGSAEVREQVGSFNRSLAEIGALTEQRLLLGERAAALGAANTPAAREARLRLHHEMDLLALRLQEKKTEHGGLRAGLRAVSLLAVETPAGGVSFVSRRELQERAAGPVWRLVPGSAAIDPARLPLAAGGAVIGTVPGGLPEIGLPVFKLKIVRELLPYAVIISLLGFMEAISIAKAMAARTGQKLDANQELIGQGLANVVGAFAGSYPVSGSFSRSAVNLQAGGRSGLSNIFSALLVLVTLLFLTPLFHHLPQAVLAAVIMMAVIGLINFRATAHAWKTQAHDGLIAVVTFAATLYWSPHLDRGILLGVALSTAVFLYRRMRPKVTTLAMGRDGVLACAADNQLRLCRHIAAVRFDGTLFFANASYLDEQIFRIRSANPQLAHILLVAEGINDLDASGEEALALLAGRLRAARIGFSLCRVKENVLAVMGRSGLLARIGPANVYPSEEAALAAIIPMIHHRTTGKGCRVCPLLQHVPVPAARVTGTLPPVRMAGAKGEGGGGTRAMLARVRNALAAGA